MKKSDYPARGEEREGDLQRESDGSQPSDTEGEARHDFLEDHWELYSSSPR